MSNLAIEATGLGKRYRIGSEARRHDSLRELLVHAAKAPFRNLRDLRGLSRFGADEASVYWALRDVSFSVEHGEVLGVIGRNGAGKSTLLKILSRITEPTTGSARLRGRVGALLEVGTGFHADLSGRQNVYLNGSILGMDRAYIARRFDEIVEFAGVERYIDTPVKRYSSGMYLRLAFAVAAFLEPEILVVDEVLAVGDAQFQKKCLGKMSDVARDGRTVLFVSHNMAAVENLCTRCLVLEGGRVQFTGAPGAAIQRYLHSGAETTVSLRERSDRSGTGRVRVVGLELRDTGANPLDIVACGTDVDIVLHYEADPDVALDDVVASVQISTQFDVPVFLQHNRLTRQSLSVREPSGSFVCRIPRLPLAPSTYRVRTCLLAGGEVLDLVDDASSLTVVGGDFFSSGEVPPDTHGCSLVDAAWRSEPSRVPQRV
jgi:lipopolysaccharide transport system ATP-binding protein